MLDLILWAVSSGREDMSLPHIRCFQVSTVNMMLKNIPLHLALDPGCLKGRH